MPDTDILYCFNCRHHVIIVERRARDSTVVKCRLCGDEHAIGTIRGAMRLAKIEPERFTATRKRKRARS
jgi:hypothetical protein